MLRPSNLMFTWQPVCPFSISLPKSIPTIEQTHTESRINTAKIAISVYRKSQEEKL